MGFALLAVLASSRSHAAIEAQKVRLGIENYALSQATLDQVFIRLASEQEKEEGTGA